VRRVLPDACAPIPPFVRCSAVRRLRVSHAVVGQVRAPEHVPARDVGLDGLDPSTSPLLGCFGPFSVTVCSQFRVVRMSPEYSWLAVLAGCLRLDERRVPGRGLPMQGLRSECKVSLPVLPDPDGGVSLLARPAQPRSACEGGRNAGGFAGISAASG
jgi:hypothetical protein